MNPSKLEKCINDNYTTINYFRDKIITELSERDKPKIKKLFEELRAALMIETEKKKSKSHVSAAKALHALSPNFFPPWDNKISSTYTPCKSRKTDDAYSEAYFHFCEQMKKIAEKVSTYNTKNGNIVKLIDEYNMATYSSKREVNKNTEN